MYAGAHRSFIDNLIAALASGYEIEGLPSGFNPTGYFNALSGWPV